jgi:hypothetical protein
MASPHFVQSVQTPRISCKLPWTRRQGPEPTCAVWVYLEIQIGARERELVQIEEKVGVGIAAK